MKAAAMIDQAFTDPAAVDALALLLGEPLHVDRFNRNVWVAPWDDDQVVKVEQPGSFQNVLEWEFWDAHQYTANTAGGDNSVVVWLAPCIRISPRGTFLVQERTRPVSKAELPDRVPVWMSDLSVDNAGRLPDGRIVLHDYAYTTPTFPTKTKKADWL